ncbi:MAG: EpsG family protein [Fusicatenibacter saccharivorans]
MDEYIYFVAGTDYMSWCQNGIRQFLAIAIIMAGFPLLLKRKYIPLTAIILLGATFHASALAYGPDYLYCAGESME